VDSQPCPFGATSCLSSIQPSKRLRWRRPHPGPCRSSASCCFEPTRNLWSCCVEPVPVRSPSGRLADLVLEAHPAEHSRPVEEADRRSVLLAGDVHHQSALARVVPSRSARSSQRAWYSSRARRRVGASDDRRRSPRVRHRRRAAVPSFASALGIGPHCASASARSVLASGVSSSVGGRLFFVVALDGVRRAGCGSSR